MGRIKSALIKRTARTLLKDEDHRFNESFERNKKILGNTMPSKRLRNRIAGSLTRMVKNEQKRRLRLQQTQQLE